MPNLDIILPCYNPVAGWDQTILASLREIEAKLPETKIFVILVNDGSTKGISSAQIEKLHAEIPHFQYVDKQQNGGKGAALRQGMLHSKHDFCIFTDVDFPYTSDSFVHLFQELNKGEATVVVGARDELYYGKVPPLRVKISKLFKFFVRKFFSLPVNDTQCGLKGMRPSGKQIFAQTTTARYLFDLEFIHLFVKKYPGKLVSVPVELKPDIEFSAMNWKILLFEGWSFLLIFFRHLFR